MPLAEIAPPSSRSRAFRRQKTTFAATVRTCGHEDLRGLIDWPGEVLECRHRIEAWESLERLEGRLAAT